jgi:hypothetical protein
MEHVGDPQTVATLADDYTRAGGRPLPRGVPLFASGAAVWLNFLRTRALLALDETHSADHRSRAAKAIPSLVRDMPSMRSLERAAQAIR